MMYKALPKIILASQSPRRKELLEMVGISFDIIIPNVAENYPHNLPYQNITAYLAEKKAQAVFDAHPNNKKIILAADTLVFLNGKIMSKPKNLTQAKEMLHTLSGKMHEVFTSICMLNEDKKKNITSVSEVYFNPLSKAQIDYYVDTYAPLDKAGAYSVDEWIGGVAIHYIKGDFFSIKGLPVNIVINELMNW